MEFRVKSGSAPCPQLLALSLYLLAKSYYPFAITSSLLLLAFRLRLKKGYLLPLLPVELLMKATDQKIFDAITRGQDEKAIGTLYELSFRKIRDFIRKNSGSQEDAEDMFQDAILALFKMIKSGKYNTAYELEGFLYTVARNLWINKAKREQRKLPLLDGMEWASADTLSILSRERENIVQETFGKIGERCKQLLTLVIYFDHSMKELCEKMGFPNENAAKTQHYKCKQRLIELMGHNQEFKNLLKNAD